MPNQIPQDWDGEAWTCYQIAWPQSDEFEQMLRDMLYMLTRGRWWDETTGRVKDMQAIAWEMFRRNLPLSGCGQDDDNDECIPQSEYDRLLAELEERYTSGAGALIEGDDDMGQVVTDVKIENGKLKVYFGPCCVHEYDMCICNTDPLPDDDLPDDIVQPAANVACRKAYYIVYHLQQMAELIADDLDFSDLYTAYPWVSWDYVDLIAARLNLQLVDLSLLSLIWGETASAEWQSVVCRLARLFEQTYGLNSEEWSILKNTIDSTLNLAQAGLFHSIIDAMGPGDTNTLAKRAAAMTFEPDCSCVDADAWPSLDTPADGGWYFGEEQEITITATGSSGWTPTEYDFGEQSHDVVGYVITQFSRDAGQLKRMSSSGTSMFNDSGDMGAYGVNFFNVASGAPSTLDAWFQSRGMGYTFSSTGRNYGTIAAPELDAPVTPIATFNLGWNVSAEATIKMRLVFNVNSPSHSA